MMRRTTPHWQCEGYTCVWRQFWHEVPHLFQPNEHPNHQWVGLVVVVGGVVLHFQSEIAHFKVFWELTRANMGQRRLKLS